MLSTLPHDHFFYYPIINYLYCLITSCYLKNTWFLCLTVFQFDLKLVTHLKVSLNVLDCCRRSAEIGESSILVVPYFSPAFDTIRRSIRFERLCNLIGLADIALNSFRLIFLSVFGLFTPMNRTLARLCST